MKMKILAWIAVTAFAAVLAPAGCVKYGKIIPSYHQDGAVTIEMLQEKWEDYYIYDHEGGTGRQAKPAVVFDPKGDARSLAPEGWSRVESREALSGAVQNVLNRPGAGLYRILGPEDQVYGFLFTTGNHAISVKVVDEKRMAVVLTVRSASTVFKGGGMQTLGDR